MPVQYVLKLLGLHESVIASAPPHNQEKLSLLLSNSVNSSSLPTSYLSYFIRTASRCLSEPTDMNSSLKTRYPMEYLSKVRNRKLWTITLWEGQGKARTCAVTSWRQHSWKPCCTHINLLHPESTVTPHLGKRIAPRDHAFAIFFCWWLVGSRR